MKWNWQQPDWPKFKYDEAALKKLEDQFLYRTGFLTGAIYHLHPNDKNELIVELMSQEALKTSKIEGEYLDRDSLQSSIRRQFHLEATDHRPIPPAEQGIAEMMVDLHRSFDSPLSNSLLFSWHRMLTRGRLDLKDVGRYRTHLAPMQVVSGRIYDPKVHFEAPPSASVQAEMKRFLDWFNETGPSGQCPLSALTRSGIAHLYFVSIHPFEDGNGRMGRAISEKALAECLGQPTLIALAETIERKRKEYYEALGVANKNNVITSWLTWFSKTVLEAEQYTETRILFLIEQTKLFDRVRGLLNPRQEKVLHRMLREGPDGFKGGLSAENYIRMTKTSRATATRDLHDLVEKRALVQQGERKHTRYYLNIALKPL